MKKMILQCCTQLSMKKALDGIWTRDRHAASVML